MEVVLLNVELKYRFCVAGAGAGCALQHPDMQYVAKSSRYSHRIHRAFPAIRPTNRCLGVGALYSLERTI